MVVAVDGGSGLVPIAGFGGDDLADAAVGVGDVASVSGDTVEVELLHGLVREVSQDSVTLLRPGWRGAPVPSKAVSSGESS